MPQKSFAHLVAVTVVFTISSVVLPQGRESPGNLGHLRATLVRSNHRSVRKGYATYDSKGNMISVISLFDLAASDDCKKERPDSGVISRVEFNNKREIESFSVRVLRKGRKPMVVRYDFPPDPYDGELEPLDRQKLPTLIREGNRVRVESYACGLKAFALFCHSIYKL